MNLILLFQEDFIDKNSTVHIKGRRLEHILNVHRASAGDSLTVGLLNGKTGKGKITEIGKDRVEMVVDLPNAPPPALPVNLILALPRPKVISRVIQSVTSLGIKKIWLINAYRVEKSYWQSPRLTEENLYEQIIAGLEQAKDTKMPEIIKKKLFKPFVEDELPDIIKGTTPIVAHPGTDESVSAYSGQPVTIAIGPEGGFIEYEIEKFLECGFRPVTTGTRILKVETVLPYIIGSLS